MREAQIEGYRLSPQQKHLWSLHRQDGPSPYRAWLKARIEGPLDVRAMQQALADACRRHEILRTFFHRLEEMDVPLQIVSDAVAAPLPHVDLSAFDREEATKRIEEIEREMAEPPDLSRAPLVRARLATVGREEHLLRVSVPSLCADARSLDNLLEVVARYYGKRVRGEEPDEEPLQYVDASTWLNEVLDSEETRLAREFWGRHDLGSFRDTRLPFERPRDASPFAPRRMAVALPSSPAPGPTLMTCWQWLLSRLSGETGVLVSVSCPVRDYEELSSALGVFSRQVPLTGDVPGSLSLAEASERLRALAEDSGRWALCFERNRFQPEAEASRLDYAPYVWEEADWPGPWALGDATLHLEERRAVTDRFKLKLVCENRGDVPRAFLEFDAGLYREEDVATSARALEALIADAVANPHSRLEELNPLTETERRALLLESGEAGAPSIASSVHEVIESRAREFPDRIAVASGDDRLCFAALDESANRLAHRLLRMGTKPEDRIAFCLERTPEAIVAMLAILKAGGAFVPLDPRLPPARSLRLLEECGASVLVSRETVVSGWPPVSAPLVLLDRDRADLEREPGHPVARAVTPERLAYVLFTSGSSGQPKGVAIEHRQLLNYTAAVRERLALAPETTFASVSTLGADLGNTSIFAALCGGGTLHLVPDDCTRDPDAYAGYSARHGIDALKITPSHLEMLLTASRPSDVLPRKALVLGGEPCPWELVRRVRRMAPELAIVNHYGPTETTVGVSTYRLPAEIDDPRASTVPIGRPLRNVRAYVLDHRLAPVPAWVPGELYIGGANVARGYLHAPSSEQERFLPDPFCRDQGARMYRTGDVVRRLPDGNLEFLGRADNQVKIRGYRVELGEIEAALRKHPLVEEAAVILRRDADRGERIVGYIVPKAKSSPAPKEIRAFLGETLPEFMVPSAVVVLKSLPLNANGKLDRRALPHPGEGPLDSPSEGETALSPWEIAVRDLWREILGEDAGVHDNFYDLGGHSLLAIRAVAELEKRTGLRVSPRELVFHTLRQFAAVCEAKQAAPGAPSA